MHVNHTSLYRLVRPRTLETKFLICTNRPESPWFYLPWNIGRPLANSVQEPVVYYADYDMEPEDIQLTNGIQFLVSEKAISLFKKWNANIETFNSEIIFPSGKKRTDYYSVNVLDAFPVVKRKLSVYRPDPDFPDTKIFEIQSLVIDTHLVPATSIFIMAENVSYLLVSEQAKREMEQTGLTGICYEEIKVV